MQSISTVMPRRAVLRGLAAVPIMGAGAVLGSSSAQAALPVSDAMLKRYVAFIAREHHMALRELAEREHPHHFLEGERPWRAPMFWTPDIDLDSQIMLESAEPSTRAVAVLRAAGLHSIE